MKELMKIKLAYIRDVLKSSTFEAAKQSYEDTHDQKIPNYPYCCGWMNGGIMDALRAVEELLQEEE